jgi:hypothetical protein
MRSTFIAALGLATVLSAAATPASAHHWVVRSHHWGWRSGFANWYGAEPPVRLGLPADTELERAVLGLYPYNEYGYNYGGWIAYVYPGPGVVRARY